MVCPQDQWMGFVISHSNLPLRIVEQKQIILEVPASRKPNRSILVQYLWLEMNGSSYSRMFIDTVAISSISMTWINTLWGGGDQRK